MAATNCFEIAMRVLRLRRLEFEPALVTSKLGCSGRHRGRIGDMVALSSNANVP